MTTNNYNLIRLDADEGKVFDWANLEEHLIEDEEGNTQQEHLYVKTLFLSDLDSPENYIEVEEIID